MALREGRMFATGQHEVLLGKALVGRFAGAALGGKMTFADREWTVVGIADHRGTAHDSEVWGDIQVMAPTFERGYSTATLALTDRAQLDGISAALATDPAKSELLAKREVDYWRALSQQSVEFVSLLGAAVGVIFAFGAVLGALDTMYAQVSARARELGTLRAIGFKPRAILVSLVLEGVLHALGAGVLGVLAASLLENMSFELSLGFAMSMGYAGGLLPALRAARLPIVNAVRAD